MVGFIFQVAQQKCRFFSRASPKQKQSCSPQGASTFVRRRRGKYSAEGLSCPYVRLHLHTPWSTIHHAWGARQPTAGARAGAAVESLPAAGPAGGPPEACAARRRRCSPQALPAACTEKITYYDARGARRDRKIVPSSLTWRAVPHTPYPVPHTPYPVPMVAPPPSLDGYTPYLWRGRGGRTPLYPIPQYPCRGCTLVLFDETPVFSRTLRRTLRPARRAMLPLGHDRHLPQWANRFLVPPIRTGDHLFFQIGASRIEPQIH